MEFCESVHIIQSMGKARCPYDNAPMERHFNALKNECLYPYEFQTEEALYQAVEEFAYVTYNQIRPPHSHMDAARHIRHGLHLKHGNGFF